MKVATWNVERVSPAAWKRAPVVREALRERAHDLIVLTESHRAFSPHESFELAESSAVAPDRTPDERWVCIWLRRGMRYRALELHGEAERSAAVLIHLPSGRDLIVFGTVLPWRGDTRQASFRGARAFLRSLELQASDIRRLRAAYPGAHFCCAGDLNQEVGADGPVGSAAGRQALETLVRNERLVAVTGGERDPLLQRGWRRSIDHLLLDEHLAAESSAPEVWPDQFPLPGSTWPDHYGVEATVRAV